MTTRRTLLRGLGVVGTGVLAGCLGGDDGSDDDGENGAFTDDFTVTSPAFEDGGTIPERYTADGENISPPLSFGDMPEEPETLAVIMEDPDAPSGTFVHWLLWNVPGDRTTLPAGIPQTEQVDSLDGARQGTNDFEEIGYSGPAPPEGDDPHTYRFNVYAVDATLDLDAGAERDELEAAVSDARLGWARLTGEYGR